MPTMTRRVVLGACAAASLAVMRWFRVPMLPRKGGALVIVNGWILRQSDIDDVRR